MDTERVQAALRDASDTRHLVIEAAALGAVAAAFGQGFGEKAAVVVADETTFEVAGRAVHERLVAAGRKVEAPIIFPGAPTLYADFANVLTLESRISATDAVPVAVGSGTLNDLTKLAAYRCGRPYMVVATAASMDGYTAFGAAITQDGFKQTMACPAPRVVLADLDILAHAPPSMNAAGYGDLLGKVTAGADWLLADALDIEPVDPRSWSLVQDSLRAWTARPEGLPRGDRQAVGALFEGLILTGIAMQLSQSSRPASGSEHRFSHLWEMQALGHGEAPVPHGFKVGIGTLAATALYEWLLARDLTRLDIEARVRAWPSRAEVERSVRQAHALPALADNAVEESLAKHITPAALRDRLTRLREHWPVVREKLSRQLLPREQVAALLEAAGCPTDSAAIGVDRTRVRVSYSLARTIRRRYTVLDLVYEIGLLDASLDDLFAPQAG
ncbi:MAG: iron-containing alcohol dehydrogenase [Anaerolineae bacterium]|nr:iron-containing alcohol dehydrogenase [Anaerolineae bacterium]